MTDIPGTSEGPTDIASVEKISVATHQFMQLLGQLQNRWLVTRPKEESVLVSRLAVFCAYRAMMKAFDALDIVADRESYDKVLSIADSIWVKTGPREELNPPPKASA